MKRQLCILGSTGSIGTQALDIVAAHADRYEVYALTANTNVNLLAEQARRFRPAAVVIADETCYDSLQKSLADCPDINVYAGSKALDDIVQAEPVDMVLTAMVGFAGLSPTIHAIQANKIIALANKETLVVAGELIVDLALKHHTPILPVDSEHSAIFQSIVGEGDNEIEKILLTASGGPFRNYTMDQMRDVKAADALRHPTWTMGQKITIDSASMMNKGFEVIEARWLFNVSAEKIEVLIHPQSIVHSAVQFVDGAVKAQLGIPDMHLPIQYAFSYPDRIALQQPRLDLTQKPLEVFHPDVNRFPCLALAYQSLEKGGNMPCVLNAANEVVNAAFRRDECGFLQMAEVIGKTMEKVPYQASPTLEQLFASDAEARRTAEEMLG